MTETPSRRPGPERGASVPDEVLRTDELVLHGRIMPASNATFLGEVAGTRVVYKPVAGERPLWDFPDGNLAGREVAAYLVSELFGWDVVPRTWLRNGPHGPGMVQCWREPDEDQEAVTLVPAGEVPRGWRHVFEGVDQHDQPVALVHEDSLPLRRMAVFDVVVNNADRKGGHVLAMSDGHRYGVDHGITFHAEHKLRTVLWGWLGEPLTDEERTVLGRVADAVSGPSYDALAEHLTDVEVAALLGRIDRLLALGELPAPRGDHPAIPWPPF